MLSTHARVLLTSDAEILIWKKGMGTKMDGRKTRVQYSSQLTFLSLHTVCEEMHKPGNFAPSLAVPFI